jgi:uncharacterized protein
MEQHSPVQTSHAEATDYEPFMTDHGQEGDVHWIRTSGADGVALKVGLWRALPGSLPEHLPVTFAGAETLFVLEGRLDVEVTDGEDLRLAPNDIATFEKGTETVWRVHAPFKALMVISN